MNNGVAQHFIAGTGPADADRLRQSQMGGAEKGRWSHADDLSHRTRALGLRVGAPFAKVCRPCLEARRIPLANMLP